MSSNRTSESTIQEINFENFSKINTGCLENLDLNDKCSNGYENPNICIPSTKNLRISLTNEDVKQNFYLSGNFDSIYFYISNPDYLKDMNKIFSEVKECKELAIRCDLDCEEIPTESIDFSFVTKKVTISTDYDENDIQEFVDNLVFNEQLEKLSLILRSGLTFCPKINYSNTALGFFSFTDHSSCLELKISDAFKNENIKLFFSDTYDIKIFNAEGRTFGIYFYDEEYDVHFDEEPKEYTIHSNVNFKDF